MGAMFHFIDAISRCRHAMSHCVDATSRCIDAASCSIDAMEGGMGYSDVANGGRTVFSHGSVRVLVWDLKNALWIFGLKIVAGIIVTVIKPLHDRADVWNRKRC